jgi:maltose O-acetyltransferase
VIIGNNVWVAMDVILLPGVVISDGAVVGAGAVVTKNVPENTIVAGNPAKIVGYRNVDSFSYSPVRFAAPFEAWLEGNMNRQIGKDL